MINDTPMDLKTKAEKYIFNRGKVNLLEISGPEAAEFLHRLATVNFKKDFAGSLHGAFLNGQAKLISIFDCWKTASGSFSFFIEPSMFEDAWTYLEQMHFSENFEMKKTEKYCLEFRNSQEKEENTIEAYNWGFAGKYLFTEHPVDELQFLEHKQLLEKDYDALRAQWGYPKPLVDLTRDHLFIEAPLEDLIDRNKGCYPGQEVIEKVFTYGRLPRKILPVQFSKKPEADLPMNLLIDDNTVGFVSSVYQDGENFFGIATLKRIFLEKNTSYANASFEMTWS
jgi:folate-binding protein YgfZ